MKAYIVTKRVDIPVQYRKPDEKGDLVSVKIYNWPSAFLLREDAIRVAYRDREKIAAWSGRRVHPIRAWEKLSKGVWVGRVGHTSYTITKVKIQGVL